jgi:hypothetical protein
MPETYKCSICGKECSGLNGLMLHKAMAHPDKMKHVNPEVPMIEPVKTIETKILSDPLEDRYNYAELNERLRRMEQMQRFQPFQQSQPEFNDPDLAKLDKILSLYMKVGLVKQLQSSGVSDVVGTIKAVKSLNDDDDYEEPEQEQDLLTALLLGVAGKYLGADLSGVKIPASQNVPGGLSNPSPPGYQVPMAGTSHGEIPSSAVNSGLNPQPAVPSDNMNLPPEKVVLEMEDRDLKVLLKPHVKSAKQINLTKEQALHGIFNIYPNFPEERFNKLWDELMK